MPRRKRFQKGRMVNGEFIGPGSVDRSLGSGKRDDVPALLTAGEYVVRKETVDLVGEEYLNKLNATGVGKGFGQGELASPARFNRGGKVRNRTLVTNNYGRNKMPRTRGLSRTAHPGGKRRGAAGAARYQKGGMTRRMARPGGKAGVRTRRSRVGYARGGMHTPVKEERGLYRTGGMTTPVKEERGLYRKGGMTRRMSRPGGKAGLRGRGYQTFARGGSVQKSAFAQESLMVNNRSLVELPADRTDMIGSGWRGKRR